MFSAIRKLFKPHSKAAGSARRDDHHEKQGKEGRQTPPPPPPPPRARRQHNREAASAEERAPLKRDGGGSSGSDTFDSARADDDTRSSTANSAGSAGTGSGTNSSDNTNDGGDKVKKPTLQQQHQQQHQQIGEHGDAPPTRRIGRTGRTIDEEQRNDMDRSNETFYNPTEDPEDEEADDNEPGEEEGLDLEDSCQIPFIADATATRQEHQATRPQQHHQQHSQQSKTSLLPQQQHTTDRSAISAVRKTEVDQLLTGQSNSQRRDSVRGNLEELRVAESVNYRPVVYRYSFRVHDVPYNMRVFTDPDDRRIEAIARSCDSQIHLEKLAVRGPGSMKMRKVTIQSPDLHSLEKCCRQFDDRFPHFYVSGGLGQSSKSIQRVYVDELEQQ